MITRALADLQADLPAGMPAGMPAELARELDPDVVARGEKTLVEEATHLTPRQLRRVGRHLLDVAAPEVAEARERDRLDRQDAAAYATARLTMRAR